MEINNFRTLYVTELQEARSMEEQIADALPKMIDAAHDSGLKDLLGGHLSETRSHVDRVAALLEAHGAEPRKHRDQSMQTIIAESENWAGAIEDPALSDAALIASAQRIEHYEVAVYGSLAAWAKHQGLDDVQALLSILEEEKSADTNLTDLAKRAVNLEAAA